MYFCIFLFKLWYGTQTPFAVENTSLGPINMFHVGFNVEMVLVTDAEARDQIDAMRLLEGLQYGRTFCKHGEDTKALWRIKIPTDPPIRK